MDRYILDSIGEIFIYFEIYKRLEPKKILDIGMLLKREGATARAVMGEEIGLDVRLDGVDLQSEIKLPIYETIYDHIISAEDFKNQNDADLEQYDLIVMLSPDMDRFCDKEEDLYRKLSQHCHYLLINGSTETYGKLPAYKKSEDMVAEGEVFSLIEF